MVIKLPEDYLYLVGDTHSIEVMNRLIDKIPIGATILHVGDCGVGRNPGRSITKLAKHAANRQQQVYIIRGNHDNPSWYPHVCGAVHLLGDYTELEFPNGSTALCVGGGISLDRCEGMPGYDYWSREITPFRPQLCKPVDFLFLHDAPSYFNNQTYTLKNGYFNKYVLRDENLLEDCTKQRDVIDQITAICKPKYIYGGHFHNSIQDRVGDMIYRCLDINEIYLLSADIARRDE
jgi:hypothetical protein